MRTRTAVALIGATLILVLIGFSLRSSLSRIVAANPFRQVAAYDSAISVLYKYVQDRGRWPTSWDDMTPENASATHGAELISEIRRHVNIDFSLTLEKIATMNPDRFVAGAVICTEDPGLGRNDPDVIKLIELARLKAAQQPPKQ
jgi:hypothetical protein